jgi:purine-binding chemotaxis protein CheW
MAIKRQEVDLLNENLQSVQGEYLAVNALVKLNRDLTLLRESIRKKKSEREQARKEGKKIAVDLGPEIRRLVQLPSEIDNLSRKLKSFELTATGKIAEQAKSLSNTLGQLKAKLEGERNKLEAEREFDKQHEATIQQEPEALKELPIKPTESATAALPLQKKIVQAAAERPQRPKAGNEKETKTTEVKLTRPRERLRTPREIHAESPQTIVETSQGPPINSEGQTPMQHMAREHETLNASRRAFVPGKIRFSDDEEERALQTRMIDELKAMKSELLDLKARLSGEQQALEERRREIDEEKRRIEEQKKALESRSDETLDERTEYILRRMKSEFETQRMELGNLKRSLQYLGAENDKERGRLEKERETIMKARLRLEREKQAAAQKTALLRLEGVARNTTIKEKKQPGYKGRRGKRNKSECEEEFGNSIRSGGTKTRKPGSEVVVVLGVTLAEKNYGIDNRQVKQIIPKRGITPVPKQPNYVEGIIDLRGTSIPIIDLKKRFGLDGTASKKPRIVIVESNERLVGLLVDAVGEVTQVPIDRVQAPPSITTGIGSGYLRGICGLGDHLLIYLDVDEIVGDSPVGNAVSSAGTRPSILNEAKS